MNMIWHYHIASEANSPRLAFMSVINKRVVNARVCKKSPALVRIEGNKIQRRIVTLKYPVETWRPVRHE